MAGLAGRKVSSEVTSWGGGSLTTLSRLVGGCPHGSGAAVGGPFWDLFVLDKSSMSILPFHPFASYLVIIILAGPMVVKHSRYSEHFSG